MTTELIELHYYTFLPIIVPGFSICFSSWSNSVTLAPFVKSTKAPISSIDIPVCSKRPLFGI